MFTLMSLAFVNDKMKSIMIFNYDQEKLGEFKYENN